MLYEQSALKEAAFPPRRLVDIEAGSVVPKHPAYLIVKIGVEWVVVLALAVIALPLIAVMAILTKLTSPGPAFYRQVRTGKGGRPFGMLKIRTMTHNCEATTGPVWSASGADKRVTRLGRFLRETHLDELPQLMNVLLGQMSLIGPRPERPELIARLEKVLPRYRERLLVRPGLTGLAQVQRAADADIEDVRHKLAHDIYYVREASLWLDLRIVLCTAFHLMGLLFNATGKLLVRSHGENAERELPNVPLAMSDHAPHVEVA